MMKSERLKEYRSIDISLPRLFDQHHELPFGISTDGQAIPTENF
jgi:hypothetical protein